MLMTRLPWLVAPLVLAGCSYMDALVNAGTFYYALREQPEVTLDGRFEPEEAPGYLRALAITFGDDIPERYQPLASLACLVSSDVSTDYDAEGAAICSGVEGVEPLPMDNAGMVEVAN